MSIMYCLVYLEYGEDRVQHLIINHNVHTWRCHLDEFQVNRFHCSLLQWFVCVCRL